MANTDKMTLFTTIIEDFDALRKEYEEYCDDNEIEPKTHGEYEFFRELNEWEWDDFQEIVKRYDNEHFGRYFLVVGSCGTWQGRSEGGFVCASLLECIMNLIEHVDDVKISLENGAIEFCGLHHDGCNYYTIYPLNKRARKAIDANMYDLIGNRELNEKLDKDYYKALFTSEELTF